MHYSLLFRPLIVALAIAPALLWNGNCNAQSAQDIQFVEQYALSSDRESTLKQLVPGTEPYYYYHCLHYLTTEQLTKAEEMLKPWIKRLGKTKRVKLIQNRLALLKYGDDPQSTLDYLRKELSLNLNHQRQIPQTQRDLPTKLNPSLIDIQKRVRAVLNSRNTDRFTDAGLELLADQKLTKVQRRHLLQRLQVPDYPGLVKLIVADLKERDSGGFGRINIHRELTLEQLDECAKLLPKLMDNNSYVETYLSKLHPSSDVNWREEPAEHRAFLDRLWSFVKPLSPKFNSLKACILYRQLELDRNQGIYDRSKFISYLKLPRQIGYVNPQLVKSVDSRDHIVNLSADYRAQILLVPIINDEPLVRDYLQRSLRDANDESQFRPYVRTEYLKVQFATVKILNGLGDSEKWASYLTPSAYQQLVDRIDLDFARTNPKYFEIEQPVELELHTKNVKNLIVKVFEINTFNYYRKQGLEIDTNISLDGLVPNFEDTYEYEDAPALRVKRKFKLHQIKGPGVFVVDFIGNGKSSRALIRKGRLSMIGDVTVAGHRFKVVDSSGEHLKQANLWIAGRRHNADKQGQILVPFSNAPGRQSAIISHGNFSCLQAFDQLPETYSLEAAMLVDRESLLRSNQAEILIRPSLSISGHPVSTELMQDAQLEIITQNLDGLSQTKMVKDLKFGANAETVCKFLAPPRLKNLNFKLTCTVKNLSQNRKDNLAVEKSYSINEIDRTDEIQDVHLTPADTGHYLEVLGKSGESRAKQAVRLSVLLNGFKEPVDMDLQSDANGRIELGKLANVNLIKATLVGGSQRAWEFRNDLQTYYQTIHAVTDQEIVVPALESIDAADRDKLSLFEIRSGRYTHDRFNAIKVANGLITITGLAPGDYRLRLKPTNHSIDIRVTEGKPFEHVLIGKHRQLEARGGQPVYISNVKTTDTEVQLDIANVNDWTRVHIIGTRYMPRFGAYGLLNSIRDIEPSMYIPPVRRSVYMAGRAIGDEYQYILDRKYAQKYPGNLLERPSLLLNPWELRSTQNQLESLDQGDDYGGVGNEADKKAGRKGGQGQRGTANADFANLDFLSEGSMVLANLKPEADGKVRIDRKLFGDHQHIRLLVLDAFSTSERRVNLAVQDRKIRDLRLANAMDPGQHFSQSKQVDILSANDLFGIDDILSAKFQHYDDLGDVYRLLNTLNGGGLNEFEFILGWSDYDDEKKYDLYSRHACHELNYFLFKKDREFFDSVVFKHLEFKRDKTFMDRWLLDESLAEFIDPWKYAELNIFERILLSQKFEEFRPDIARNVRETYLLSPTPRAQFGFLFDTGIQQSINFGEGDEEADNFYRFKSELLEGKSAELGDELARRGRITAGAGRGRDRAGAPMESAAEGEAFDVKADADSISLDFQAKGESNRQLSLKRKQAADKSIAGGEVLLGEKLAKKPVPATRMLTEERSRTLQDGTIEKYSLAVPRSETVQMLGLREKSKSLYLRLGQTKEWVENNYWKLPPDQRTADRVLTNQFWRDYADYIEGPFISPNFAEANRNLTEMMLALAVIDLPFKGPEHEFVYDDAQMKLTTDGPMIVLHQQVRPTVFDRQNTTILVSENFFQKNDRYRYEDGVQFDKFVSGEFSAHTLYGAQVVITNPTSTPQAIDLLIQLPSGAVIAGGSQETRTIPIDLAGFSTQTYEYFFYFPAPGNFTHFPAHVSADEKVLAVADNVEFNVTDKPAKLDKTSWAYVSQNGSEDEVIEFINKNNVLRLDLAQIAFRMKDKSFFERAIETLKTRYTYDHTIWSYSVLHNEPSAIREFLSHASSFISQTGINFDSELLTINPIDRKWHFHSEFWPLVNARAHQVGPKRKILNPELHRQYHRLMNVLSNNRDLDDDDYLVVTYYMLLQDRIDEAIEYFAKVDVGNVSSDMQYDYCDAFLDMYREEPESAAGKAEKWADYPVVHWRKRFQEILAQVEEIRGGDVEVTDDENNRQQQTELASSAPSFDFEIESRKATVNFQNVKTLTVNYYEMDIELLFSRRPFAQDELDGFSMIRPNLVQNIDLPDVEPGKQGTHDFELPAELENKNILVEIVAGDQTKSKPYFANSLGVQLIETYGQLRVSGKESAAPISKAYVKVYSRHQDGSVKFHKDGYTDLRGRFDYVSQSNNSIDGVAKYSILIMHPENGSVIRQAMPPQE